MGQNITPPYCKATPLLRRRCCFLGWAPFLWFKIWHETFVTLMWKKSKTLYIHTWIRAAHAKPNRPQRGSSLDCARCAKRFLTRRGQWLGGDFACDPRPVFVFMPCRLSTTGPGPKRNAWGHCPRSSAAVFRKFVPN